ncbi:calcium-binding protein, partial [Caulobacter sp. HMWF009]|uniref:calcium-binding protein n=1 Tax=Caulobacter sp. HMWF009 TaxID=2056846 RepID=UPI003514C21D
RLAFSDQTVTAASVAVGLWLTGTGVADSLTGGASSDVLTGGLGNDSLNGGSGTDAAVYAGPRSQYVVTPTGTGAFTVRDTLVSGGEGTDWLVGVEQLWFSDQIITTDAAAVAVNLVGTALADTLIGAGGADTLDGGVGLDSLVGGAGDDLYVVDNAGDVVVELAGGGYDTVQVSKNWVVTAGAMIERAVLTGTANLNLTGNLNAMLLDGNSALNTLDDGGGAATMRGAGGNDTYIVRNAGTVVVEAFNDGYDVVRTSLAAYSLTDNVDNLVFIGTGNFAGTGNAIVN